MVKVHVPPLGLLQFPDQESADKALAELDQLWTANPLHRFRAHSEPQREFIEATSPIIAAFAGNRFGKSTALTVTALREALPKDCLPDWLKPHKRFDAPTAGWIVLPSEDKIVDSFEPAFKKWTPPGALRGGNWGKAYNGASRTLHFACGSTIAFKTYKQDAATLGGAALHWVGYDEPPPKTHREECMMRLSDYGGFEMFAMTPLKINTGYIRREIWKKRESPDITVVKGSIHDNPHLDKQTVNRVLGDLTDIWRQAREFGDFVDVGGLIYPDFERCVVKEPFDLDFIRSLDIVVGIDPGIRNAGFAWVGFDKDWSAYVFHEGLLQDKEAHEYAGFVKGVNSRLQLDPRKITYVVDPAARNRGQVNATTVMSALAQEGIYANPGQNDHEAGFDQMRARMRLGRFHVNPTCVGMRDEADDYAAKEPGEFDDDSHLVPVSNQFHRLDACFVAGTMIATEWGGRPIETIKPGELVWTRQGLRPVLASAMTDPAAHVYDLGPLRGTGNHPVWTDNRGWVELNSVRYADIIRAWTLNASPSTGSRTTGTPLRLDALIASTSDSRGAISTGPSSSATTGRSPMAGMFTTATKILSTTTPRIWSACRRRTTPGNTGRQNARSRRGRTRSTFVLSPPHGIGAKRVVDGTSSMAWILGGIENPLLACATSVGSHSSRSHSEATTASALTSASRHGDAHPGLMTLTASALSAARPSASTSTSGPRLALGSAAHLRAQTEAVYNLTVEGCPEYFANGVLVHNCRYAVMERFWDPRMEEKAPQRTLGWVPGKALTADQLVARAPRQTAPMGFMS